MHNRYYTHLDHDRIIVRKWEHDGSNCNGISVNLPRALKPENIKQNSQRFHEYLEATERQIDLAILYEKANSLLEHMGYLSEAEELIQRETDNLRKGVYNLPQYVKDIFIVSTDRYIKVEKSIYKFLIHLYIRFLESSNMQDELEKFQDSLIPLDGNLWSIPDYTQDIFQNMMIRLYPTVYVP